jgi:hypothetical protein
MEDRLKTLPLLVSGLNLLKCKPLLVTQTWYSLVSKFTARHEAVWPTQRLRAWV